MACIRLFKNLNQNLRRRKNRASGDQTKAKTTVDSCTQTVPPPIPPKINIFWLPRELLMNIVNRLGPADIVRLSWTNKRMYRMLHRQTLWKSRIEREFGPKGYETLRPDANASSYISAYRKLSRKVIFLLHLLEAQPFITSCADWEYAWLQSGYWEINANENSKFHKTADLSKTFVWWLHGHKTHLVQPGIYKITWALQLQIGVVSRAILDAVSLNVVSQNAPSGQVDAAYRILFGSIRNQISFNLPETFHEFEMPGYIRIPFADSPNVKEWCRVKFEIRDTESQRPKSGINLDYVKLTPIDSINDAPRLLRVTPYYEKESAGSVLEPSKSICVKADLHQVAGDMDLGYYYGVYNFLEEFCGQPNTATMPLAKIEILPTELIAEVVLYLVLPDIISLALTSKTICQIVHSPQTWQLKIHHDFGYSESAELSLESPAKDWADEYERLLKPIYSSIADWEFAWIDNRYWRVTDTPTSPFGKTLNLDNRIVWWVAGQKTFPVPPGRYKVTWGLQVSPRGMAQSPNLLSVGIRQVKFRVKCLDSYESVISQVEGSLHDIKALDVRDWTEITFKGVLDVPFANSITKELCNVNFEESTIKIGLNLDFVKLTRIFYDEEEPAQTTLEAYQFQNFTPTLSTGLVNTRHGDQSMGIWSRLARIFM